NGHAVDSGSAASTPAWSLAPELEDAERLLAYAADVGIEVEASIRHAVLSARMASQASASLETRDLLLAALTKLAAQLKPVTAASLKLCASSRVVDKTMNSYRRVALALAICIIPFSLATFVTSGLSEAIRKELEVANKLAVKLGDELRPLPPDTAPAAG